MWDGSHFSGTKIALIIETHLIAYLRDDKPDIPFPGMWDLPGGGREGDEDPIQCALREVSEEFGLAIASEAVVSLARYPSATVGGLDTYFCLTHISEMDLARIEFGEEGQRWLLMPIVEFLKHEQAIPHLKPRLQEALLAN